MTTSTSDPTVADIMVAALSGADVDRVFCVAGESYLALLEALYNVDVPEVVTCRHEGSAGFAAIADAKLSGTVGVCLVNRGPGAMNGAIAVHAAAQDATPLLLVVGQVPRASLGSGAFQEIDYTSTFATAAKAVLRLYEPERTAEVVNRALRTAVSGTPGPVVLEIPEDVFGASCGAFASPPVTAHPATAPAGALTATSEALAGARRPLLLAGGALQSRQGRAALRECAERLRIPVVTSNKRSDLLDHHHPLYCGHLHNNTRPPQWQALAEADLVIAVGTRLDDVTTHGHRFPASHRTDRTLVHVHADPDVLGRHHRPEVAVAADPGGFLLGLAEFATGPGRVDPEWLERLRRLETDKSTWRPHTADDGVPFGAVVAQLQELTGGAVTATVDSGSFTSWVFRYLRLTGSGRLLGITCSAMGFALPAAVAAALRGHRAVALVGDGGLVMNGGELATAVEHSLPLTIVVADNGSYGTIRAHQERHYPGHTIATGLHNPDFAALATAFGAMGLTVESTDDIAPALAKALDHPGPALVAVRTSLEWISAYRRLPLPHSGQA